MGGTGCGGGGGGDRVGVGGVVSPWYTPVSDRAPEHISSSIMTL